MSQCTDVDKALKNLEDKINAQNREIARLRQLQQQCCANKGNDNSLAGRVAAIERYINALDRDIKGITGKVNEINEYLQDIFKSVDGFFEKITNGFAVIGRLFGILK